MKRRHFFKKTISLGAVAGGVCLTQGTGLLSQTPLQEHCLTDHISFSAFFGELNQIIPLKKIAIFIDEFEGIPLKELENFLNTLRSLYHKYKTAKVKSLYSVGLVGVRNIIGLAVTGVSPYNIADRVKFPSFSLKNVRDLYRQYTEKTNQPFTEEAVKKSSSLLSVSGKIPNYKGKPSTFNHALILLI